MCQTRISKYANAVDGGKNYNADGTDLTNTGTMPVMLVEKEIHYPHKPQTVFLDKYKQI